MCMVMHVLWWTGQCLYVYGDARFVVDGPVCLYVYGDARFVVDGPVSGCVW